MLDRTVAPPYVQDSSYTLINPSINKLRNGADVIYVSGGSQDVIKVEILFAAGRWYEEKWGTSTFTASLLSKGTKSKTSFQIAQLFDLYGAHLEVSPGLDYVSIAVYSLSKNIEPVIALLKEILVDASFPEKELEQSVTIYTQNLKVNLEKTSFLASQYFRSALFGDGHPYGKELTEQDVNSLSTGDLKNYLAHFRDFTVFVSGKVSATTVGLIDQTFQSFPKVNQTAKLISWNPVAPGFKHIEKDGSVQASIRLGAQSITRAHRDYAKVLFATHILGGYFGSRLMKNIREEKGLTYGIYAAAHPLKHAGYFVIGADVDKENISITVDEIRKELKLLRTEPVSPDELLTARNHFIGSLQSEITTPFAHADKIKTLYLSNLPADYYQQLINTINAMKAADIIDTADRYMNEEQFFGLAVG